MSAIEFWLKIGAFVISILVFIKGIYEYTKAQKWKVAEFVSREVKEFYANIDVERAFLMLDWNANYIELKEHELEGVKRMHFTDNLILTALLTHKEATTFTSEEVIVKGVFDRFFDRLSMFENYIESGLISVNDIKPYLIYWISILADSKNDRKSIEVRNRIWRYIDEYGYDKVRSISTRMGFLYPKQT